MAGFLSSIARASVAPAEAREKVNPKHPRDPVLASIFGDPDQISVTPETAMKVTAVYACVSLIAETLAGLPKHVYRRERDERGRETSAKFTDHPLYPIIHDMPVRGMTSFEWHEAQVSHTALRGDSFARIVLGGDGRVMELPPILPAHIQPFRNERGRIAYRWWPDGVGPMRVLFDDEVLRIPHKMMDGLHSLSPIATHRQTIGNSMLASSYLQSFYRNSAQPKGGLKLPEAINDDAAKTIRESWERRHRGPENAGRIAIFDGGMEWVQIGMNLDDAQYLELQKFGVSDIARIFLVPPHKIGDLSNATFSNIEHQAIEFVVDTILRWVRRIEMRYNAYLLSPSDRAAGVYIAFDLKGLLRGDAKARANFYRALFYIGAMSPNEIRAAEDMNPHQDGDGYYVQGATTPIDALDRATGVGGGIDGALRSMMETAIDEALEKFESERTGHEQGQHAEA